MFLFQDIYRFLFPPKEELYFSLKEILTFPPRNLELYKLALLHKSMSKTDRQGHHIDNERLEFLGDAIIEAVVSNYLFRKYGLQQEGFLTTMRSKLVRRSTLGIVSKRIGLDRLIQSSIPMEAHNSFIGGNAFEALFGAMYLDLGYGKCQKFFLSLMDRGYINLSHLEHKEQNFKSRLLEWCQKNHIEIDFKTVERNAGEHAKTPPFTSFVYIEQHVMGDGFGYSKKESHQQAAHYVLKRIEERPRVAEHILEDRYMRQIVADIFHGTVHS